jgi:chaperonin cofactor prefoldin
LYWRKRAKVLKDQIAAVDKQIEDLNQKIREKKGEGIMVGMGTYTPYMVAGLNNLQSQISALQREKERLQKEYSDLEEEARKAGVMPGWLR